MGEAVIDTITQAWGSASGTGPPRTEEGRCSAFFSNALGTRLALSCVKFEPGLEHALHAYVRALATVPSHHYEDWMASRYALQRLAMLVDAVPGKPGPERSRYSISHADGQAWAVVAVGGEDIGIDFEPLRPVTAGQAAFFLDPSEQLAVRGPIGGLEGTQQQALFLRLWTIKEAIFKADRDNKDGLVFDYVVEDPTAAVGFATGKRGGTRFRYASTPVNGHAILTVAIRCLEPVGAAHFPSSKPGRGLNQGGES